MVVPGWFVHFLVFGIILVAEIAHCSRSPDSNREHVRETRSSAGKRGKKTLLKPVLTPSRKVLRTITSQLKQAISKIPHHPPSAPGHMRWAASELVPSNGRTVVEVFDERVKDSGTSLLKRDEIKRPGDKKAQWHSKAEEDVTEIYSEDVGHNSDMSMANFAALNMAGGNKNSVKHDNNERNNDTMTLKKKHVDSHRNILAGNYELINRIRMELMNNKDKIHNNDILLNKLNHYSNKEKIASEKSLQNSIYDAQRMDNNDIILKKSNNYSNKEKIEGDEVLKHSVNSAKIITNSTTDGSNLGFGHNHDIITKNHVTSHMTNNNMTSGHPSENKVSQKRLAKNIQTTSASTNTDSKLDTNIQYQDTTSGNSITKVGQATSTDRLLRDSVMTQSPGNQGKQDDVNDMEGVNDEQFKVLKNTIYKLLVTENSGAHYDEEKIAQLKKTLVGQLIKASEMKNATHSASSSDLRQWSPWQAWSACSKSCGDGVRMRRRTCGAASAEEGSAACLGSSLQGDHCVQRPCPIDGGYTTWTSWSGCSETCGQDSLQMRMRICMNPRPQFGGKSCTGSRFRIRYCHMNPCHGEIPSHVEKFPSGEKQVSNTNVTAEDTNDELLETLRTVLQSKTTKLEETLAKEPVDSATALFDTIYQGSGGDETNGSHDESHETHTGLARISDHVGDGETTVGVSSPTGSTTTTLNGITTKTSPQQNMVHQASNEASQQLLVKTVDNEAPSNDEATTTPATANDLSTDISQQGDTDTSAVEPEDGYDSSRMVELESKLARVGVKIDTEEPATSIGNSPLLKKKLEDGAIATFGNLNGAQHFDSLESLGQLQGKVDDTASPSLSGSPSSPPSSPPLSESPLSSPSSPPSSSSSSSSLSSSSPPSSPSSPSSSSSSSSLFSSPPSSSPSSSSSSLSSSSPPSSSPSSQSLSSQSLSSLSSQSPPPSPRSSQSPPSSPPSSSQSPQLLSSPSRSLVNHSGALHTNTSNASYLLKHHGTRTNNGAANHWINPEQREQNSILNAPGVRRFEALSQNHFKTGMSSGTSSSQVSERFGLEKEVSVRIGAKRSASISGKIKKKDEKEDGVLINAALHVNKPRVLTESASKRLIEPSWGVFTNDELEFMRDRNWTQWTPCSKTCGVGYTTRQKATCLLSPKTGTHDCSHWRVQKKHCVLKHCQEITGDKKTFVMGRIQDENTAFPNSLKKDTKIIGKIRPELDADFLPWSSWGQCSATCGEHAVRVRTRRCESKDSLNCHGPTQQTEICTFVAPHCSVDGSWSVWSNWTPCFKTCGDTVKVRMRKCNNPAPAFNGKDCEGSHEEHLKCHVPSCAVNGSWSPWAAWGKCSHTCGAGHKIRSRTCTEPRPSDGGLECTGDRINRMGCYLPSCPVDGSWSVWSNWTPCSSTCGDAAKVRMRKCNNPTPAFSGKNCEGGREEHLKCHVPSCAVNGSWSSWAAWGQCSHTCGAGHKVRSRTCTEPRPSNGGLECSGDSVGRMGCYLPSCAVDGSWSVWSNWTPCSRTCGDASKVRMRKCNNPTPAFSGKDCEGNHEEHLTCHVPSCAVNGSWSSWTSWGQCTHTCGAGHKVRSRTCTKPRPSGGGLGCSGNSIDRLECYMPACPVDGGFSEWHSWTKCHKTCGSKSFRTRLRFCNNPSPQNGGKPCNGDRLQISGKCPEQPCPVNGGFTEWTAWSACNHACGDTAVTSRERSCTNPPPSHGGHSCTGRTFQITLCANKPCRTAVKKDPVKMDEQKESSLVETINQEKEELLNARKTGNSTNVANLREKLIENLKKLAPDLKVPFNNGKHNESEKSEENKTISSDKGRAPSEGMNGDMVMKDAEKLKVDGSVSKVRKWPTTSIESGPKTENEDELDVNKGLFEDQNDEQTGLNQRHHVKTTKSCDSNPCDIAKCLSDPFAACVPNKDCDPVFYDSKGNVKQKCNVDTTFLVIPARQMCEGDPCETSTCLSLPGAKCVTSALCHPVFFDQTGNVLNCTGVLKTPVRKTCGMDPCIGKLCTADIRSRCFTDFRCKSTFLSLNFKDEITQCREPDDNDEEEYDENDPFSGQENAMSRSKTPSTSSSFHKKSFSRRPWLRLSKVSLDKLLKHSKGAATISLDHDKVKLLVRHNKKLNHLNAYLKIKNAGNRHNDDDPTKDHDNMTEDDDTDTNDNEPGIPYESASTHYPNMESKLQASNNPRKRPVLTLTSLNAEQYQAQGDNGVSVTKNWGLKLKPPKHFDSYVEIPQVYKVNTLKHEPDQSAGDFLQHRLNHPGLIPQHIVSEGLTSEGQTSEGQINDHLSSDGLLSEGVTSQTQSSEDLQSKGLNSEDLTSEGHTSEGQISEGQTSDGFSSEGLSSEGIGSVHRAGGAMRFIPASRTEGDNGVSSEELSSENLSAEDVGGVHRASGAMRFIPASRTEGDDDVMRSDAVHQPMDLDPMLPHDAYENVMKQDMSDVNEALHHENAEPGLETFSRDSGTRAGVTRGMDIENEEAGHYVPLDNVISDLQTDIMTRPKEPGVGTLEDTLGPL